MTLHRHTDDCYGEIDGRLLCGQLAVMPGVPRPIVDQPPPVPNDSPGIWSLVIADMRDRDKTGFERYGTRLQAHNGRDALVDAYQEALDLVVYLRQAIAEREG